MNAYKKIKAAMKENERELLRRIKAANKTGKGWHYLILSVSWFNALDRLVESGKVKYRRHGPKHGYHAVSKK